jgi:hypothetical protein
VLGAKATKDHIMGGVGWLKQHATKKDLVVVYVGCHGGTDPKEGWGITAADGQGVFGHDIKRELGHLPCQAIVILSTCGSGGFAQPHKNDPPLPPNVTALCACGPRQHTNNHIDVSVAEALCGRADFNRDGVVDVDELLRYVDLRYKEWLRNLNRKPEGEAPVLARSKTAPAAMILTKVAPDLAAVAHNGQWHSALLGKKVGDGYKVWLVGWAPTGPGDYFLTDRADREHLCLPGEEPPVLLEKGGKWVPARLMKKEGKQFTVKPLGKNAEEETVLHARVRFPFAAEQQK